MNSIVDLGVPGMGLIAVEHFWWKNEFESKQFTKEDFQLQKSISRDSRTAWKIFKFKPTEKFK